MIQLATPPEVREVLKGTGGWMHLARAVAMDQTLHKTTMTGKRCRLIGPDGQETLSPVPGTLGVNRRRRVYGRLDCRSTVGSLPTGYATVRVSFADQATALAAGYRPCANDIASALKASRP